MSDLRSPSQPASPVASITPLDQLVAEALTDIASRPGTADAVAYARAAVDAVAQHIRDANLRTALPLDPLDPRLEAAIDDYMSGPAEPTADDTIVARVGADGRHHDIRHAGGR